MMESSSVLPVRPLLPYPQISNQTPRTDHFSTAAVRPAVLLQLNLKVDPIIIDRLVFPPIDQRPHRFLHCPFLIG